MPIISIDKAQPGHKLIRPAVTRAGMTMVQPGTQLTAAIIERLRNLGIETIAIEGQAPVSDRSAAEVRRELDARFAGHEQNPLMMSLKEIVLRQAGIDPANTPDA